MKNPKHLGLKVKRFPLANVAEHPDNPRNHPGPGTPEWNALRASLENSYFDPCVVNVRGGKNVLVSGHYRRKVMLEMGIRSADMVVVDWDEPTHRARMLAANELLGHFDDAKLAELLKSVQAGDTLQDLTGLTDERLKSLLEQCGGSQPESDVDAEPQIDRADELRKKWGVERGQVWGLGGGHRLMCGGSTDKDDVSKLTSNDAFAVCVTDPPYSVDYDKSQEQRGGDAGVHRHYSEGDLDPTDILNFMAFVPSKVLVFSYPIDRHFSKLNAALARTGWEFRKELVWVKNNFSFWPGAAYQQKHEPILVCTRDDGSFRGNVPANEPTVFEYSKPTSHELHPTAKPVELWERLIRNHSNENELVYEPFSGSGTTIIACERLNRRCRAMEISPAYVAVAIERWATATGKTPVLL